PDAAPAVSDVDLPRPGTPPPPAFRRPRRTGYCATDGGESQPLKKPVNRRRQESSTPHDLHVSSVPTRRPSLRQGDGQAACPQATTETARLLSGCHVSVNGTSP